MNVIQEFVISLGFQAQWQELQQFQKVINVATGTASSAMNLLGQQFARFHGIIGNSAKTALATASGMIEGILKWQTAVVGMFRGVATATVGLADKVAMADQGYRLFAMRMFMTQEAGKSLKTSMDLLHASLEELAWDPELRARGVQLGLDNARMAQAQGKDFEALLMKWRDLDFEYVRLKNEARGFVEGLVASLLRAFGTNLDEVIAKLKTLNEDVLNRLPEVISTWTGYVVPILKETWGVLKEVGGVLREMGVVFVNLVGLFSRDDSLKGTTVTFSQMATAISHLVEWLGTLIHWVNEAEMVVLHFANAVILALSGHFVDATNELKAGLQSLGPGAGGILGGVAGGGAGAGTGALAGAIIGLPLGPVGAAVLSALGALAGGITGTVTGAATGAASGAVNPYYKGGADVLPSTVSSGTNRSPSETAKEAFALAQQIGPKIGVDPKLVFEQFVHETGNFKSRQTRELNNLAGITNGGREHGFRHFDSLQEFGDVYAKLLASRYNVRGLTTTEEFAAALKKKGYYEESYSEYAGGMKAAGRTYDQMKESGSVQIGQINVHVMQPKATKEEIYTAAARASRDEYRKQSRIDLAQIPSQA